MLNSAVIAGLVRRFGNGVDGDKVDVAQQSLAEAKQFLQICIGVVHVLDHNVFERHAPVGCGDISCKAFLELC